MDLTTREGTRSFLLLCLDGRRKRTAAQLVRVLDLQAPMADAVELHAPELADARQALTDARKAAAKANGAAARAQEAYATALETWVRTPVAGLAG